MGKFKEQQYEAKLMGDPQNPQVSETGFTQPTFVGLIELIKGFSDSKFLSSIFTSDDLEIVEKAEYNPDQLYLFESEAI